MKILWIDIVFGRKACISDIPPGIIRGNYEF